MDVPKRRHILELKIGADDLKALMQALRDFETKIAIGNLGPGGVSGGVDYHWTYAYTDNPGQTHDKYFAEVKAYLKS